MTFVFLSTKGIRVDRSDDNQIGGTASDQRNLIAGVRARGVEIFGGSRNVIEGNFFGSDITGLRLISETGLPPQFRDNLEHPYVGVAIVGGTTIPSLNNRIGGTAPGAGNLFRNTVGVLMEGAPQGTTILGNTFTLEPQGAISLGRFGFGETPFAPNDPLDADGGPNGQQNFPVLTSVTLGQTTATASGTLSSSPNRTFRIELFVNPRADIAPGGTGQGAFAAAVTVTTNAAGAASYSAPLPGLAAGSFVAATATDLTTGDTSMFSEPIKAISRAMVTRRGQPEYAVAAGSGGGPRVRVFNIDGTVRFDFFAYEASFTGGVRVALADITGDGVRDVVTGTGPGGGPLVKVFDGVTGALTQAYFAYDTAFRGGVNVAAGRGMLSNSVGAMIVTGPGAGGGPHIKVFRADGMLDRQFFAYDASFRGGVTVALQKGGDVPTYRPLLPFETGLVVGPGPGMAPLVREYIVSTGALKREVLTYDAAFRGGVSVGYTEGNIYVVPGPGGGPVVRVFPYYQDRMSFEFLAFEAADRRGSTISFADVDRDGGPEVLVGSGRGGPSRVRAFGTRTSEDPFEVLADFAPFEAAFQGGVFVG